MRTVTLTVKLVLDAQTDEEVNEIIQEMDYYFSYIQMVDDNVEGGSKPKEYILNIQIIN